MQPNSAKGNGAQPARALVTPNDFVSEQITEYKRAINMVAMKLVELGYASTTLTEDSKQTVQITFTEKGKELRAEFKRILGAFDEGEQLDLNALQAFMVLMICGV